ncbi:MAG: hypothetical protein FWD28_09435 [Treponema sp.]|nr:hypothetical protein [Treponema sp.]
MKTFNISLLVIFLLAAGSLATISFAGCQERFPSTYILELPKAPQTWVLLLGEPHWRVEWVDSNGNTQISDIPPKSGLEIDIPIVFTNPVTAWPFWPEHNLIPGLFKPAGALFPYDVSGNRLILTWEAGADTVFYWELITANDQNFSRLPANFDWLRFRELFTETLDIAVREDPWVVDWRSVAERTAAGNFDRRRLVPQPTVEKAVPVPGGTWYGSSPFAKPLVFEKGETPVFPVRQGINVFISAEGILRINSDIWIFIEWQ